MCPGYCGPGDWLGEAPADPDKYEDAGTYDVVIVGGGHAGVGAAFGAVDEGATVAVIEKQAWGNFVDLGRAPAPTWAAGTARTSATSTPSC